MVFEYKMWPAAIVILMNFRFTVFALSFCDRLQMIIENQNVINYFILKTRESQRSVFYASLNDTTLKIIIMQMYSLHKDADQRA